VQAVSQKRNENVRFNPMFQLMVNRTQSQIVLQIFEGGLDFGDYAHFREDGNRVGLHYSLFCAFRGSPSSASQAVTSQKKVQPSVESAKSG
jgi:hypothetical protein